MEPLAICALIRGCRALFACTVLCSSELCIVSTLLHESTLLAKVATLLGVTIGCARSDGHRVGSRGASAIAGGADESGVLVHWCAVGLFVMSTMLAVSTLLCALSTLLVARHMEFGAARARSSRRRPLLGHQIRCRRSRVQ
jgi:hypothetical protein